MPYMIKHPKTGFIEFRKTPEEKSIEQLEKSNEELIEANRRLTEENESVKKDIQAIKEKLGLE